MPDTQILTQLAELEALATEWDELAVLCARPTSAPAWVLAWWRHLAGEDAMPRVVAVRDRDRLIGVAPFAVGCQRRLRCDYRLPGADLGGELEPLAYPGREWDVAGAVAAALPSTQPRPDVLAFEGAPIGSVWPKAMHEQWPGPVPPYLRTFQVMGSPRVSLGHGSFEDWMAGRSANFRSQMRRARRRLAKAGGTTRMSTASTLSADLSALLDLHARRWAGRGVSGLVAAGPQLAAMLQAVGADLIESGRFELQIIELEGRPIAAQLFLAAGDRVVFVNGGWDPQYPHLLASQLNILAAIEHNINRGGVRALSLGPGMQPYKLRFSDGNEPVAWSMLIPPQPRMPLTAARVAPVLARYRLRYLALRALSPEKIARVREVKARLSGQPGADAES